MKDKVVVITGASSGIGKALAEYFGMNHSHLVLAARRLEPLEEVAESLRKDHPIEVLSVPTDVAQREDCLHLIEKTVSHFGRIDILINNAGITMRALFEDVQFSVMEQVMNINFWGTVYCTQYALPYLKKSKGCVVGVSSIAGLRGLPERCGYSASKFAMHGLFETMRIELLHSGVHVMLACPGFTASNIRARALTADGSAQGESPRDEGNMMSADMVAHYIYHGILRKRKLVVLTQAGKLIVWINKWWPGLADRLLYRNFAKERNTNLKP